MNIYYKSLLILGQYLSGFWTVSLVWYLLKIDTSRIKFAIHLLRTQMSILLHYLNRERFHWWDTGLLYVLMCLTLSFRARGFRICNSQVKMKPVSSYFGLVFLKWTSFRNSLDRDRQFLKSYSTPSMIKWRPFFILQHSMLVSFFEVSEKGRIPFMVKLHRVYSQKGPLS